VKVSDEFFFLRQLGTCAFGDECYKQHVLLDPTDSWEGAWGEDASAAIEPEQTQQPVPICEYFHRGKCTFGDNCVKSHDPLPLYKKDLKDVVLRTAAEVAAERKAAGQAVPTAASSNKSSVKGIVH
jgi:hypothetical protein